MVHSIDVPRLTTKLGKCQGDAKRNTAQLKPKRELTQGHNEAAKDNLSIRYSFPAADSIAVHL